MARAHEEWRKSVARVMPVFLRSQNKNHFSIKKIRYFGFFFVILHPKTTLKAIDMKRIFISMTGFITCMNLMAQTPVSFYPQENDQDINIDTHLVIVFDKTVKTGSKGIITVTDKTTRKVVDRIDMSIPAGPTEGQPLSLIHI